jgi:hypothetical protein
MSQHLDRDIERIHVDVGDHLRPSEIRPRLRRRALFSGAVANAEAKNLEAISRAIDQHNSNCPFPASEVRMNPFEVERLGWDEIRGLPIVPDPNLGTGAFRIICSRDQEGEGIEEAEALGIPIEVAVPAAPEKPPA